MDALEKNCIDDPDITIVVKATDLHNLTDEDSAGDDVADINRLSGNQLRAPAFIESASIFDRQIFNLLDEVPIIVPAGSDGTGCTQPKRRKIVKKQGYK